MGAEAKADRPRVRKAPASGSEFAAWGNTVRRMAPARKIDMIRKGVDVSLLVGAGKYYGISQTKLSRLLGI
jgi:hypothetical protein